MSIYRSRRRRKLWRRRRATAVAAFSAVLAFVVGIPTLAAADPVNDVLNDLGLGSGSGSDGGSVTPDAGTPPTYSPPLHGTNPHGQGSDAVVDLAPSNTNPYPGTPDGDEEIIVGDSRGEQTGDGSYHGTVALAYLFGNAILGVETNPGESKDGPLQPLQDVLDQICDGSSSQVCLSVLEEHSSTTGNSSTNSFEALGAHVGGDNGINADVATSHGNISDDGTCQTAHGDSSVADANVGPLTADALQASSTSTACNNGSQSVDQSSTVVGLGGQNLPLPTAGCENGTPNTNFTALSPVLATVCNADDTNGSQTSAPYGVREALTLFALITGDTSVIKATTAGPESHAVAPAAAQANPPAAPGPSGGTKGAGGKGGNNGGGAGGGGAGGGGAGGGAGAAAGGATAGNGQLAFTGADLLVLGMVGGALVLGGLALTTTAGRRHRQAV